MVNSLNLSGKDIDLLLLLLLKPAAVLIKSIYESAFQFGLLNHKGLHPWNSKQPYPKSYIIKALPIVPFSLPLTFVLLTIVSMDITSNRNEDWMRLSVSEIKQRTEKIKQGGGKKAIEKQKEKNRLTPRERVAYLCDTDKP